MKKWIEVSIDYAVMVELAEARQADRFFIREYICDGPCRKAVDQIGTSTFAEIFVRRPDKCRYAIVEPVDRRYYMVIDLYDTRISGLDVFMGNNTVFPTYEAAIAAPMLTYDSNK